MGHPGRRRVERQFRVNGASVSPVVRKEPWQRFALDLLLLAALGLLMSELGPYRTVDAPPLASWVAPPRIDSRIAEPKREKKWLLT